MAEPLVIVSCVAGFLVILFYLYFLASWLRHSRFDRMRDRAVTLQDALDIAIETLREYESKESPIWKSDTPWIAAQNCLTFVSPYYGYEHW